MGWLSRLFPGAQASEARQAAPVPAASGESEIPAAKVGLQGEFDESGLAKRVALAFDSDSEIDDVDTLWVAQLSSKVVLNGRVPSQQILDKVIAVAIGVSGATEVDASQVTVG